MAASDRRTAMLRIGALISAQALFSPGMLRAQSQSAIFPVGEFVLRRELERGLGNDDSLLVTRDWRAVFERSANGAVVTGEQISCTVVAPPILQAIADIERSRRSTGPFPAALDDRGMIVGSNLEEAQGKSAAVRAAIAVLEQSGQAAAELVEAKAYLGKMAEAAGAITNITPVDLFYPVAGQATDRRTVELPGGTFGEVTVHLVARNGAGGLLDEYERRIVTQIGEDRRLSRERWSLARA